MVHLSPPRVNDTATRKIVLDVNRALCFTGAMKYGLLLRRVDPKTTIGTGEVKTVDRMGRTDMAFPYSTKKKAQVSADACNQKRGEWRATVVKV